MRTIIAWLLLLAAPAPAVQTNTGVNTAQFLQIGAGARALGMAEAYGPVAEGADAIYWNPAGLAQLRHAEFAYTRSEMLGFLHHDFAAYAQPVSHLDGTLAVSFTRLSQDQLPLVTNSNQVVGAFTPHSDAVALAYAHTFASEDARPRDADISDAWSMPGVSRPLDNLGHEPWTGRVMLGLSVKAIDETIYERTASAFAVDGGALFRPQDLEELSMSFAFRNAGSQERFVSEVERLPAEMDLGAAWDQRWWDSRLIGSLEAALPYYGNAYGKLGLELSKPVGDSALVALRGGYKSLMAIDLSPLTGLTFGVGVRYRKLSADFAFEPAAELGQIYRFSVGLRW